MYKWFIKIYLKSGKVIKGYYLTEHKESIDIMQELFVGDANALNAINKNSCTQIGFVIGSVEAFEIIKYKRIN